MTGIRLCILLLASTAFSSVQSTGESSQEEDDSSVGLSQSPSLSRTPTFMNRLKSLATLPSFKGSGSPTSDLDTVQLAEWHGYGAERHSVTTEDGYILGVHRIYKGAVGPDASKPVAVLHHAFLLNSREFLILGPERSLGFVLADAGYDVWLCNARGNTHSRKHTTLSPDSKEFWNFSVTELGMYDIPAVIDYALKVTGKSKVHYIGHSIGTISFLIMGSKRPDIVPKVLSYTALAPLTTVKNVRSLILQMIMKNYRLIAAAFEKVGSHEILASKPWLKAAGKTVCNENWYTQALCTAFLSAVCGDNPQLDKSISQEMLTHSPSGSSLKTFRHFGQNFFNGFREYDYGARENLARYNSEEPPMFDYSKIDVPSQLYFGINDLMVANNDAIEICKTLPRVFRCEAVPDEKFSHMDFIWAKNAHAILYPRLIDGLQHFENQEFNKN